MLQDYELRANWRVPVTYLTSLELDFGACSKLADVSALGAGLEKLVGLTSLKLDFGGCEQLSEDLQKVFSSKDSFLAAVGA